jgi:hypothetical protein
MNPALKPKRGAIAKRADGRPAYLAPIVRTAQPVTNREWQEARRRARHQAIWSRTFEGLFAKLLGRVKG